MTIAVPGPHDGPRRPPGSKPVRTLAFASGVALAAGIAASVGPLGADDTEIYLTTSALTAGAAQPNVLIVLDTSSSMSSTDATSPPVTRMDRMKDGLHQLLDAINNVNVGLMRFHYRGGPVLYPVADVNADVCAIEGGCPEGGSAGSGGIQQRVNGLGTGADDAEESASGAVTLNRDKVAVGAVSGATVETTVSVRITSSDDDVEELFTAGSTGTVNTGSTDLELFKDGSTQQAIGLHFANVQVDPGATITTAYVTFTVDANTGPGTGGVVNADITGHASDNSPDFAVSASIAGRARTAAKVDWNAVPLQAANTTVATADLKTIVQELVNRAGWANGRAMAFIVEDDTASPSVGMRRFFTRNGSVSKAPTLTIGCTPECKAGGVLDTSITVNVSGNNGDAEQPVTPASSTLSASSSDLELVQDGGQAQVIGLRFPGVAVPNGASIVSASIEFEVKEKKPGEADTVSLDIHAESAAGARGAFTASTRPTQRARTAARADWNDAPNSEVGAKLTSADLTAVVQEVVGNAAWASGQAMVFIVEKDSDSSAGGNRTVWSFDGKSASAPLLRIKYATGGGGPTTNRMGLRFPNVRVPQGATITGAYIDFRGGAANSEATLIRIHGHDTDDAPAFTTAAAGISSRTRTSAAQPASGVVAWNAGTGLDEWGVDELKTTPDLKGIVQQIVNRAGWCGGNALAFVLEVESGSTGKRTAFAHESDAAKSAKLRISYDADNPQAGATGCSTSTIGAQPKQSADDAEEASDGTVSTGSSDLELVLDATTQIVGVRFPRLPIPQGATVLSADITFTVDEVGSDPTSLLVDGELAASSEAFSASSGNISGRTRTAAGNRVAWTTSSSPALAAWTAVDQKHRTPNLKNIVQQIVDQAAWKPGNAMSFIFTGTGKRVAKALDGDALNAPKLTVTFQGEVAKVPFTVRDRLHGIVDALEQRSGTPVLGAMVEAARYYRGEPVFYGKQRGVQSDADRVTRVSHAASHTGGTRNLPAGCPGTDSSDAACRTETITGSPVYRSPIALSCQESYIVLMTDGDGYITGGETGAADPRPMVDAIVGFDCGDGHDKCVRDLVTHLHTKDQITSASQVLVSGSAPLADAQRVHTYTVGFASDGDPQFLKDLAALGGGDFKTADSADGLAAAFRDIFASILKTTTSLATPSLTVNAFNRLFHRDEVYFSLFEPDNNVLWSGNVKKYRVCSNPASQGCKLGEILDDALAAAIGTDGKIKIDARSIWSSIADGREIKVGGAGAKVPASTARRIYTDVGASGIIVSHPASPVALGAANEVVVTNQAVRDQACGDPSAGSASCDALIRWIRGVDVRDEDKDGFTNDERWKFQDPLHSSPVAITYGGTASAPIDKVFVGTNDGGVRMINAKSGVEEWSFLPAALLANQQTLHDNPEGRHVYGLDLTPVFRILDRDRDGVIEPGDGDFVHMFIGMRRGGRNLYALDVTPAATLTDPAATDGITPKFMWRIEGGANDANGDFSRLGHTFSRPVVTSIRVAKSGGSGLSEPKTVLVFGGGYDPQLDEAFGRDVSAADGLDLDGDGTEEPILGNAVYVVDPASGKLMRWFGGAATAHIAVPGMAWPIPSDLAIFDSNGDGHSDRIYVGDVGGNLWRIDLGDQLSATDNGGTVIGRLAAFATAGTASLERRFFHSPDVVQVRDARFSEKARYDLVAIGSGYRAHPLSTAVADRFYAVRDFAVDGMTDADGNGVADAFPRADDTRVPADADSLPDFVIDADLVNLTGNQLQEGSAAEIAAARAALRASRGWLLDLTAPGEKVLAAPAILAGKLFFTTFLPEAAAAACEAREGGGRLYAVDVLTAGAVINFDATDGNVDLTRSDRTYALGAGIPSSAVPIFQEKGVTLLVGSGGGATTVDPEILLPRRRTFWYQR